MKNVKGVKNKYEMSILNTCRGTRLSNSSKKITQGLEFLALEC